MDKNLTLYVYDENRIFAGKVLFTKTELAKFVSEVESFPGVEDWSERIRKYGEKNGVIVRAYIISSGFKEMVEGTSIAKMVLFKKIYATFFYCDEKGCIQTSSVVNYNQ